MNIPRDLQDKLDAAKYLADKGAKYLAKDRAAMRFIWSEQVPTAAADKHWRIYVNPEFAKQLTVPELGYVILHEVSHCVRAHHRRYERLPEKDAEKWGLATDAEINCSEWPYLVMPSDGVTAEKCGWPPRKIAEEYYFSDNNTAQDKMKSLVFGSAVDGEAKSWELPADDKDNPGLDVVTQEILRLETAQQIVSQGRGCVPGSWEVWAGSLIAPKIPWQTKLARMLSSATATIGIGKQSYRRVRVRGTLCMPRHIKPKLNIAVVLDTSGSMGTGEGSSLQKAVAELIGIAKVAGNVNVIWTDTSSHIQRNVKSFAELKPQGGGGTDMSVGIKFADELKGSDEPDIIITISDGWTPWPEVPPKHKHITVLIGSEYGPDFGEVIHAE